ncbi:hypothetical protein IWX49DRAFT_582557 [Phyllosticta citricarpa]|uniref:Uncharacterized protein n=2 Tax=Phyllosticta TaxID=121621 RepID=A0ABR1LEN8_9PEZI
MSIPKLHQLCFPCRNVAPCFENLPSFSLVGGGCIGRQILRDSCTGCRSLLGRLGLPTRTWHSSTGDGFECVAKAVLRRGEAKRWRLRDWYPCLDAAMVSGEAGTGAAGRRAGVEQAQSKGISVVSKIKWEDSQALKEFEAPNALSAAVNDSTLVQHQPRFESATLCACLHSVLGVRNKNDNNRLRRKKGRRQSDEIKKD